MMGVFNNLVMYDQHVAQNSPTRSSPTSPPSWAWSEDGKELTFPLRQGVKWHDGKPFTAADVKCTWDLLLGQATKSFASIRARSWYRNLDQVTTNGDYEVTFHLKRPQPALLVAAGVRMVAGLSLPCAAARDAHASDRHRPVQICRIQAERGDQGRCETRITGSRAGPISTASSGTIIPDIATRNPGLHRRQVRHRLALRPDGAAAERCEEPGAAGGLRADLDECQPQPDRQPRASRPSTTPICAGRWR